MEKESPWLSIKKLLLPVQRHPGNGAVSSSAFSADKVLKAASSSSMAATNTNNVADGEKVDLAGLMKHISKLFESINVRRIALFDLYPECKLYQFKSI
jgi:hypothetical protein